MKDQIRKNRREFWDITRIMLKDRYKGDIMQNIAVAEFTRILGEYVPVTAESDIIQKLDSYVADRRKGMEVAFIGEVINS